MKVIVGKVRKFGFGGGLDRIGVPGMKDWNLVPTRQIWPPGVLW